MLNTLELFSGTGSFSQVALKRGHSIFTVDNASHADELVPNRHLQLDIRDFNVTTQRLIGDVDMCWLSPPCEAFSVAAIGKNWKRIEVDAQFKKDYPGYEPVPEPTSDRAREALELLRYTLYLVKHVVKPKIFFIENPRGMMRKVIEPLMHDVGFYDSYPEVTRHTVGYCAYGDTRQKPTDIWTNHPTWQPKPLCKPGSDCHVAAPRGSNTGTQGIKSVRDRSRIPAGIFEEIFSCAI